VVYGWKAGFQRLFGHCLNLRPMADPTSRGTYPAQIQTSTEPNQPLISASAPMPLLESAPDPQARDTCRLRCWADRDPKPCTSAGDAEAAPNAWACQGGAGCAGGGEHRRIASGAPHRAQPWISM